MKRTLDNISSQLAEARQDWEKDELLSLFNAYEACGYKSCLKKISTMYSKELKNRSKELIGAKARSMGLSKSKTKEAVEFIRNRINNGEFQRSVCSLNLSHCDL